MSWTRDSWTRGRNPRFRKALRRAGQLIASQPRLALAPGLASSAPPPPPHPHPPGAAAACSAAPAGSIGQVAGKRLRSARGRKPGGAGE